MLKVVSGTLAVLWTLYITWALFTALDNPTTIRAFHGLPGWFSFFAAVIAWTLAMTPVWILAIALHVIGKRSAS